MEYDFLLPQKKSFQVSLDYLIPIHIHFKKYISFFIFLPFHDKLSKVNIHHLIQSYLSKNWKVCHLIYFNKIIFHQFFAKLLIWLLFPLKLILKAKINVFHSVKIIQKTFRFIFIKPKNENVHLLFKKYYLILDKISSKLDSLIQC